MTSQKQIIANRRNALKSTGPCTEEGKAIVCQNAIKHGILCQEVPLNPTYGVFDDPSIKDAFSGSAKEGMAVLSRYEIAIEKSLYKALAELMRLQALRQGVHFNTEMSGIGFVSQNDESDGNSASDSL
jgi:hypothetical protein